MKTRTPTDVEKKEIALIQARQILQECGIMDKHKDLDKDLESEIAKNKKTQKER